ncbi:hypothetical protein SRHO_G00099010 [Serrasalmus rhombeus]
MAKLLTMFILQLLIGTISLCLLQRTLADLRSIHPGENITLHCEITAVYEISWYQLSSEEMKPKLLITVKTGQLDKSFFLSHNINEDHYEGTEDTRSVSLVIVGVKESDLGLYYCGGRNSTTSIQFGKAFRLTFGVHSELAVRSVKCCKYELLHHWNKWSVLIPADHLDSVSPGHLPELYATEMGTFRVTALQILNLLQILRSTGSSL